MRLPSGIQFRSSLLDMAVRRGIVNWPHTAFYNSPVQKAIAKLCTIHPTFDYGLLELDTNPKTLRGQEHNFSPYRHTTMADWYAVEVARFCVPRGEVGFINLIEQVVYDYQGNYYASQIDYWGSPYHTLTDVSNLRWYLQLHNFDGLLPNQFAQQSTVPIDRAVLPGWPYPELPQPIDGLWYPQNSPNTKTKLIVPGGTRLSFYVISPPLVFYTWMYSGRLRGWTQTSYTAESGQNARRIA